MSLSVLEATKLGTLKEMKLVAGEKGLNREINSVGILDHEIFGSIKGIFIEGDFVLTTFTAARNDEALLISSIKELIMCGVVGLGIKGVFYTFLPDEIIEFANENYFPIFIYDANIFTEDIIRDLSFGIQARSKIRLISSKIDLLFLNDYNRNLVSQIAHEINPYFCHDHVVFFLKDKYYVSDDFLLYVSEKYYNSKVKSTHHLLIKYNDGLIVILTYNKISEKDISLDLDYILEQYSIEKDLFCIGKSSTSNHLNRLDKSIKESVYAALAAELLTSDQLAYSNLGVYKFLLPHIKDKWLQDFATELLDPIIKYDNGKLMETAKIYIKNKGDIIKTAEELYQHKNTIRYRIKTMQTLTDIDNIYDFNEQLSLAVKFVELT